MILNPSFDTIILEPDRITSHVQELVKLPEPTHPAEILKTLIVQLKPIDYLLLAYPQVADLRNNGEDEQTIRTEFKLCKQHYLIISIESIISAAKSNF